MAGNKKPRGYVQPVQVLTSLGTWVNNKYAGLRTGKNTNISDTFKNTKAKTHTSKVVRTEQNAGVR